MRLHHKKNNQAYLFSDTVAVACPDSNMICNRLMGPTNVGRIVDPHTLEESEANSLMHMNTFFAGWKLNWISEMWKLTPEQTELSWLIVKVNE